MAFRNLVFVIAIAVFLQSALADPVLIRRWENGDTDVAEENEVPNNTEQELQETNVNEYSTDPRDTGVVEVVDIETVTVPEFTDTDSLRFVHDFNSNITAVIDNDNQRCFVMELDYDRYSMPTSVFDLVWKMSTDYYLVDTEVVRQNMRVVLPPLNDLDGLGLMVQLKCGTLHTYMLVEDKGEIIFKRSISDELPSFRERVGKRLFEFRIVNMNEVSDYERNL